MMEWMRQWLLGLAGAAVICTVAVELTPKGPVKRVTETLCGLALTVALLSPLTRPALGSYALNLAKYREAGAALTAQAEEVSRRLDRPVIAAELRAYRLDKAPELTDAKGELAWSTQGVWLPASAELWGEYDRSLELCLEAELGLPPEKLRWRGHGED